jgi:hypothetical protein
MRSDDDGAFLKLFAAVLGGLCAQPVNTAERDYELPSRAWRIAKTAFDLYQPPVEPEHPARDVERFLEEHCYFELTADGQNTLYENDMSLYLAWLADGGAVCGCRTLAHAACRAVPGIAYQRINADEAILIGLSLRPENRIL